MKNLLALVGLLVVVFLGVGYARGWYNFSMTPGKDGRTDVNLSVDTGRIKNDASDGVKRVGDAVDGFKTNAAPTSTAPGNGPPAPAAGLTPPNGLKK